QVVRIVPVHEGLGCLSYAACARFAHASQPFMASDREQLYNLAFSGFVFLSCCNAPSRSRSRSCVSLDVCHRSTQIIFSISVVFVGEVSQRLARMAIRLIRARLF